MHDGREVPTRNLATGELELDLQSDLDVVALERGLDDLVRLALAPAVVGDERDALELHSRVDDHAQVGDGHLEVLERTLALRDPDGDLFLAVLPELGLGAVLHTLLHGGTFLLNRRRRHYPWRVTVCIPFNTQGEQ